MTNEANGAGSYFDYYGKSPSGVEMALHLAIGPGLTPAQVVMQLRILDSELADAGFKRSDRLDKPQYGGRPGLARPEEQPPTDLIVEEHCGVPMIYKPPREATGDRKAVAARWECRKGKGCAEAETRNGNTYPATVWHMRKKPTSERHAEPQPAEQPDDGITAAAGTERKPAPSTKAASARDLSAFWAEALAPTKLNFSREQIDKVAGADVLHMSAAQLADLLEKLRQIARERAA